MSPKFNGLHRMKYDTAYANDHRHHFVQKILQGYVTGSWSETANLSVSHQLTCALLQSRKNYCDCDPRITVKHDA